MLHTFHLPDAISVVREVERIVVGAQVKIAAHASREVDDDVGLAVAHPVDDLPIEFDITRGLAGFRLAYMDVRDRCASLGRFDRRRRDFRRRLWQIRMLAGGIAGACHRTGDNRVSVHC